MKISRARLRAIIVEEIQTILSADSTTDVEAQEDSFAGGDNLELPIDHVTALGFPEQPDEERLLQIVHEELGRHFPKKITY